MTGKFGEQNSLDHIYSLSDARCSFPKAALLTKFEMPNRQNKIKEKKYDKWAFGWQSQGYKQVTFPSKPCFKRQILILLNYII